MNRETSLLKLLNINPEKIKAISVVGGGGKTSLIFRLTEELVSLGKKVIVTTTTHMAYEPERPFAENGEIRKIRENFKKYGYTVTACMEKISAEAAEKLGKKSQSGKKLRSLPKEQLELLVGECDILLIEADGARRLPLKIPAQWEPVIPEITELVVGVIGLDCLGKQILETAHRPLEVGKFLKKSQEETVAAEDLLRIAQSFRGLRKAVKNREYRVFFNKADVVSDMEIPESLVKKLEDRGISAVYGSLKTDDGKQSEMESNPWEASRERALVKGEDICGQTWNLTIIILAAGNSTRFGSNKLFYPVDGVPMYQSAIQKVLQVQRALYRRVSSVIVVTQYSNIKKEAEIMGAKVIWNSHPEEGIASSMKLGLLAAIKEQSGGRSDLQKRDACLFMVADQPWITVKTITKLIQLYENSQKGMAAAAVKGAPGNPCIFSRKYYPELLALTGDMGGKKVLKRHMEDVGLLEIQNKKELTDVDTPLQAPFL